MQNSKGMCAFSAGDLEYRFCGNLVQQYKIAILTEI